jgi:hypothetical protein
VSESKRREIILNHGKESGEEKLAGDLEGNHVTGQPLVAMEML